MLTRLAALSVRHHKLVVAAAALYVGYGVHTFTRLPIEAFPDVTDPMVEVLAIYPGQAAEDVERRVTVELERVLAGTPRMTNLRSVSVFGLALVTLRFADGGSDFQNRALVAERLREAHLPDGIEAVLGPQATPVGQILRYTLQGPRSLRELRSIQDWVVERRLRSVPGVADVVTFGGFERQYAVRIDPVRLASVGVTIGQVWEAVESANANAGGGYVGIGSQDFVVRGVGAMQGPADIGGALVANLGGVPIRVRDVADVVESSTPRRGSVGRGGDDEVVEGIVLLRRGENARDVLAEVQARIDELHAGVLPPDVRLVTFYDRRDLIATTVRTVGNNLLHGAALVVLVILVFLRSPAGALIVAAVIPISLLSSFVGLHWLSRSANLISLGAVDFGILVENATVVLEVTLHALALAQAAGVVSALRRAELVVESVRQVARPIGFATAIIVIGFVPLFLLERVEGRIFAPMAYTLVFALLGAIVAAVTVVPALMTWLLRRPVPHGEARWFAWLLVRFAAVQRRVRRRRLRFVAVTAAVLGGLAVYVRGIGTEFLPELNEGGLYITAVFPSTVGLDETRRHVPEMRRRLLALPEARDVLSHVGRPEDATQTEGPNNVEFFVALAPVDTWRPGRTRADFEAELRASLSEIPGVQYNFSQPITDRVFETVSGIIGQIVVKVRGDDLLALSRLAGEIEARLAKVHGIADLAVYQAGDVPQVRIDLDRERLAQHGLTVADVQHIVEIALGGKVATELWQGERRYGVALRLPDRLRQDLEGLGRVVVGQADRRITLSEVADIRPSRGRSAIWREDLARFVAVKFNVRGADMGSVVGRAREAIRDLELPEGVRVTWGGEFENQARAMSRLAVVVPLCLLAMVLVLFVNFRRWRPTFLIVALLPAALLFAVALLHWTGQNFSVSAAVGCITLLGQVVLGGVLVCSHVDASAIAGDPDPCAAGTRSAFRPVLLTMTMAALGLIPAALSHGMGAESQRPFATAIIGGLIGALPLVLLVLPLLYRPARRPEEGSGMGTNSAFVVAVLGILFMAVGAPGSARAAESPGSVPAPSAAAEFPSGGEDVRAVLSRWMQGSAELAAWRSELGAARFDVVTAGLLPNPSLELQGSRLLAGAPPDGRTNLGASVAIPVPISGQVGARKAAAQARLSVAEAELRWRIWARLGELCEALLDLAFDRVAQRALEAHVGDLADLARIVASRAAAGVEPRYDSARIDTAAAGLRAELERGEAAIEESRGRVLALLGAPELATLEIAPASFDALIVEGTPASLLRLAEELRPDLQAARLGVRAATAQVRQLEREALPVPSLVAGGYVTRDANSGSALLGLQLPLPVFDRNQGAIRRARSEAEGQRHQVEALTARVRAEVTAAYRARERARTAATRLQGGVIGQAGELLARARRAYQAGVFDVTELLAAYESVWSVRQQAVALERALYAGELALLRAVGTLSVPVAPAEAEPRVPAGRPASSDLAE